MNVSDKAPNEPLDNPIKGCFYFIMYCLTKSLSYVVAKVFYDHEPDLTPFALLFMRSVLGIGMMLVMLNKNLKKDTWDTVTRDKLGSLTFKTAASTFTNGI